jgi:hypothetical protein
MRMGMPLLRPLHQDQGPEPGYMNWKLSFVNQWVACFVWAEGRAEEAWERKVSAYW